VAVERDGVAFAVLDRRGAISGSSWCARPADIATCPTVRLCFILSARGMRKTREYTLIATHRSIRKSSISIFTNRTVLSVCLLPLRFFLKQP